MKRIGIFCAAAAMMVSAVGGAQADNLRTEKFSRAGSWNISALYDGARFISCYANVRYRSGISVTILAYTSGTWKLQFYKESWQKRPVSKFRVQLDVDGNTIIDDMGEYRGRSVFVTLGQSASNVRAIMRGRIMTIRSESGSSSFRLTGTNRASRAVARCWTEHKERQRYGNNGAFNAPPLQKRNPANSNDGAFGNQGSRAPNNSAPNNDGAFGKQGNSAPTNDGAFGRQPINNNNSGNSNDGAFGNQSTYNSKRAPNISRATNVLSRASTMDYATRYLTRMARGYQILPASQNVFRHFPVNWKYNNGRVGAMMVLNAANPDVEKGIRILLGDQAKNCTGRSATRVLATTGAPGRRIARASGVCESAKSVISLQYIAVELKGARMALIVEASSRSASQARPQPSNPPVQRSRPQPRPRGDDA